MKRFLVLITLLLSVGFCASAQSVNRVSELQDVIYCTDGSVLRGVIVDQIPNVSYTLLSLNGTRITIDALSIERIVKEPPYTQRIDVNNYHYNPYLVCKFDEDGFPIYPLSVSGAFFRSLVFPGWGQIYNGQGIKGSLLFVGSLAGIFGMTIGTNMASNEDLVGYGSALLWVGCYLYSIIDAPAYAARWNKQHGFKLSGDYYMNLTPAVGVVGSGSSANTAVGMNLSLTF